MRTHARAAEIGGGVVGASVLYHALYDALVTAGADLGLAHFGARALNSLRLEKRYAIEILGERRPAVLVSQPLYDVPGDRMRHS